MCRPPRPDCRQFRIGNVFCSRLRDGHRRAADMLEARPALRAITMILYCTTSGPVVSHDAKTYRLAAISWEELVVRDDLQSFLLRSIDSSSIAAKPNPDEASLLPPIGDRQEVWAAGVT